MAERTPAADTDLDLLRGAAYATPDKLQDRRALYDHQDPRPDFHGWTLDLLDWPETGTVLDLGCGPGTHLARLAERRPGLRLVGVDLSSGMLAATVAAQPGVLGLVADATRLALADGSIDAAMANHMLYHVTNLDRTLAEVRRVLRPGGTFLAVTNALDHFVEFDALAGQAMDRVGFVRPSARFNLEHSGDDLARHFDHVERHDHVGELVVPDAGALVRFAASMRDLSFRGMDDAEFVAGLDRFAVLIDEHLATQGPLHITAHAGAFICR